jgi:hypothetical protein
MRLTRSPRSGLVRTERDPIALLTDQRDGHSLGTDVPYHLETIVVYLMVSDEKPTTL